MDVIEEGGSRTILAADVISLSKKNPAMLQGIRLYGFASSGRRSKTSQTERTRSVSFFSEAAQRACIISRVLQEQRDSQRICCSRELDVHLASALAIAPFDSIRVGCCRKGGAGFRCRDRERQFLTCIASGPVATV
eukprot:465398-Hanusia_phi.AAC.4